MPIYDFVIVGQGLAGTVLSIHLADRGYSILVIDNNKQYTSSKVAAGIYNPITGKRMVKTWMADELLAYSIPFYQSLEKKFNTPLLYQKPLYRIFSSIEEQNNWVTKAVTDEYKNSMEVSVKSIIDETIVENSLGGFVINNTGYLEVSTLLEMWKNDLIKNKRYIETQITFETIEDNGKNVILNKDIKCKKLIFCDGYLGKYNPFFSYLPFQFSKGELLEVEIENLKSDYIVNGGVFILPTINGKFKVGSTYFWDDETEIPTQRGKAEISEKLSKFLKSKHQINNHIAGIRPTVNDRRPFVGFHPKYKNIGIFNGLGTKGVMLAPYFANHLCQHIENNTNLLKEVDIQRYFKFFTN